jgi:hypothetical protein
MKLPTIDMPVFEVKLPSSGKFIKMRPMNVKETKILLVAREAFMDGGNSNDVLKAIAQVVQLCVRVNDKDVIDVSHMSVTDLAVMYIRLRSQSVSNIITAENIDASIDLDKVEADKDERVSNIIKLDEKCSIELRDIPISVFLSDKYSKATEDTDENAIWTILSNESIAGLIIDDKKIDIATWEDAERQEWLEGLPGGTFAKIKDYVDNAPNVTSETKYKDAEGNEQTFTLSSIYDFFLF